MAGYSGKTIADKLGLKAGMKAVLLYPPEGYEKLLLEMSPDVNFIRHAENAGMDFIQFFTKDRAQLEGTFRTLVKALKPAGMLWVSWPKKASRVETDITENIIREVGLGVGLVDVKVCAVDEIWSGLKFVRRKTDRG